MTQSNQFKHLLDAIGKYTDNISFPDNDNCYATGTIFGYKFRLFQELNNGTNGTDDEYGAYLCIKDETAKGSIWPAFYDKIDLDQWFENLEK